MMNQSIFKANQYPIECKSMYISKNHDSHSGEHYEGMRVCLTNPVIRLLTGLIIATGAMSLISISNAQAQDCFANHQAPIVMQEVREFVENQSYQQSNIHWYSTTSKGQLIAAIQILNGVPYSNTHIDNPDQIHLLNVNNSGFILLRTYEDNTCGFSKVEFIKPDLGRKAISAANKVLALQQQQAAEQIQNQYPAKSQLMRLREILTSSDLRQQLPKYFCEELKVDTELGIVPELEELEVNSSLYGAEVTYHYIPPRSFANSEMENFFKNAVGTENAGWFRQIQHVIIKYNGEDQDIILGDNQYLCGFGSFASFSAEMVSSWFEPYKEPTRNTQPGDPLFNMSDEERRAFQMMQGILNGENPEQGLKELFTGGR